MNYCISHQLEVELRDAWRSLQPKLFHDAMILTAVVCPPLSADIRPSGRPVGTARDPPLTKVSGTVAGLAPPWDTLALNLTLTRSIPSCPFPRTARNMTVPCRYWNCWAGASSPHAPSQSCSWRMDRRSQAPTSTALPRALWRSEPSRMFTLHLFFLKRGFVSFS